MIYFQTDNTSAINIGKHIFGCYGLEGWGNLKHIFQERKNLGRGQSNTSTNTQWLRTNAGQMEEVRWPLFQS